MSYPVFAILPEIMQVSNILVLKWNVAYIFVFSWLKLQNCDTYGYLYFFI